jgi:predicted dienelactone hydrolase
MITKSFSALFLIVVSVSFIHAQKNISQETITLFDSTRNRKLVTEVWRPAESSEPLPLVMFSHGTGGNRLACSWFCEGLAAKGFMVAAVDHFGNTYDNPIPKEFVSIWNRPQDVSFVLSQLLNTEQFGSRIKPTEIYAAGFSLGGYTSLALAGAKINVNDLITYFGTPEGKREIDIPEMPGLIGLFESEDILRGFKNNTELKDNRIKGVFVMAPAAGQGFTSRGQMKDIDVPVFIVGANADSIAPVRTNALHYKSLIPHSKWYAVDHAGHYVFLNVGNEDLKKALPIYFEDPAGADRSRVHVHVLTLAGDFFGGITKR